MTTNNSTIVRIEIPADFDKPGTMIIQRGDLAKMFTFAQLDESGRLIAGGDLFGSLYLRGITELAALVENPPADISIPEPVKPAPAQKPAATKPAASKPAPVAKWWTNPDNGEVKRDDTGAFTLPAAGWFGPFDTKEIAETHIPDWLKPAFGGKKRK